MISNWKWAVVGNMVSAFCRKRVDEGGMPEVYADRLHAKIGQLVMVKGFFG